MIRSVLKTKIFFYDVLQELDKYLESSTVQRTSCILLLLINSMALLVAFIGVKKDRVSSAILSNLVVLSFFVGLPKNSIAMDGAAEDALTFMYMFVIFELAFLWIALVLSRKIKFFLMSLSFSIRATNMLEESTWTAEEHALVMLIGIYIFVVSYLFLYLLPKIGWAVIYSTVGALFLCYTVEVLFKIDCGIREQLLQGSSSKDGLLEDGSLEIFYFTVVLGILLQTACYRKKIHSQSI